MHLFHDWLYDCIELNFKRRNLDCQTIGRVTCQWRTSSPLVITVFLWPGPAIPEEFSLTNLRPNPSRFRAGPSMVVGGRALILLGGRSLLLRETISSCSLTC